MEINRIYKEDCLETMGRMNDNFIDLIVTSPPYDDIREYAVPDPDGYFFDFDSTANEMLRILKPGGVCVWIVGDQTVKGDESGTSFRQALFFKDIGFKLFQTQIYSKQVQGSKGDNRGYWKTFEYMFILTKGDIKTINLLMDRPNVGARGPEKVSNRQKDGTLKVRMHKGQGEYGRRTAIWHYETGKGKSTKDAIAHGHPAIFPDKLAEDHILSWSNENDLIYDPFLGSGTTAKMAKLNRRNYIGSEISDKYFDIATKRINSVSIDLFEVE